MKTTLLLTAILTGIFLCGCHTPGPSSVSSVPLVGTEWVLTELNGQSIVLGEGLRLPTLKLEAAKKQASGTSGINRYAGAYELNGASLKFGMLMGTRMAGPPAAMATEDAFLAAMREVNSWSIHDQILELSNVGKTQLKFTLGKQSAGAERP